MISTDLGVSPLQAARDADLALALPVPTCEGFLGVRAQTEALASCLSPEDQTVQSMPDVSPTKWHRAHVTWFFEQFVLLDQPGYEAVDPSYLYLFNSYYEGAGPRHARPQRGLVTRPGSAAVGDYRRRVDAAMTVLLARGVSDALRSTVELGLHHEQQHQELLMMDIKHVLASNPLAPVYSEEPHVSGRSTPLGWHGCKGGLVEIGAVGSGGFSFDNERPRHRVWLEPYEVSDRLVSVGDWLEFMAEGGYRRADLWLSDGWAIVQAEDRQAPLYWKPDGEGGWLEHTLTGVRPLDCSEPVVHVSYYEADAYARWAGTRLPTEAEWENATSELEVEPALRTVRFHPTSSDDGGWFGQVWQWTASAYLAHPGFVAAPGVVGEYNGKFMSGQHALKGSACVTPPGHTRATYRNFFPPGARWAFNGLRLARSV